MQNTAEKRYTDSPLELLLKPGILDIGHAADNDIRLPDPDISAYHARIVTYFHQAFVIDLSSESGTYLNGQRVIKHSLKDGDILQLGHLQLFIQLPSNF